MNPCCRVTIESLRTTQEVADELGWTRLRVWRQAKRRGIGTRVGRPGRNEILLYTPDDVERMKAR